MPQITLPDGSIKSFDHPVSVMEVAQSIGSGLAKATIAGKVNGRLVDASDLIAEDAALNIITAKDQEGVEIIRHSCAFGGPCGQTIVPRCANGHRSCD